MTGILLAHPCAFCSGELKNTELNGEQVKNCVEAGKIEKSASLVMPNGDPKARLSV